MPERFQLVCIRRVGDTGGVQLALRHSELLTQIAKLCLELPAFCTMTALALLGPSGGGLQVLLQPASDAALAVDLQQRTGLGGPQPLLRKLAFGTQFLHFGRKVPSGALKVSMAIPKRANLTT